MFLPEGKDFPIWVAPSLSIAVSGPAPIRGDSYPSPVASGRDAPQRGPLGRVFRARLLPASSWPRCDRTL